MKTAKALLGGEDFLETVYLADTFFTRLRGLMYRKSLEVNTGMLIRPCRQIHTFGMKFLIDAVFLNRDGTVVCVRNSIPPRRISPFIPESYQVLELPAGSADLIRAGSRIRFEQ